MSNLFKAINPIHARTCLVLVVGAAAFLAARPAAARDADLGRYEAMVGAPAPQLPGPTGDCDGGIAFGSGDGRCGTPSGGPSGGDSSRN